MHELASDGPVFFVFNGDADGLFSQHMLELEGVVPEIRITGLKRDIRLLERLPAIESGQVHVFDISLDPNRAALDALLRREKVKVFWYDHHEATAPPAAPNFTPHLASSRNVCTAAIVHGVCRRAHPLWAAAAAFGDNLPETARSLLAERRPSAVEIDRLEEMGVLINYNAYGETPADVLMPPADLAKTLAPFQSPLDFLEETDLIPRLRERFLEDARRCESALPVLSASGVLAYALPAEAWARRYAATWANALQRKFSGTAFAFLIGRGDGGYSVSIRAPRTGAASGLNAAELAGAFPTGGGRRGAAGINRLEFADVEKFLTRFAEFFRV